MKGNLLEVRSFEKARNVISQKSKGLCAQAVTLTVTVPGNCNYCTVRLFFFQKKTSNFVLQQQQLQHKARSYTGTLQLQLQYQ
jgi:hypothetical protein